MGTTRESSKSANLGRHRRYCKICSHERRDEIEQDFIAWKSPIAIAEEYGLADRMNVYRHANALGLFEKRRRNIRAALERIIERAGDVEVTASAVVAAIQACAKINAQGQWIDRSEHVNLNELFDRMTRDELEAYARDAKLPDWFTQAVGVTQARTQRRKTMNYARKPQPLPVAEVKPGDFPLGSMESRAAARALAERKNEGKRILMIQFVPARDGHPDVEKMSNPPHLIRRVEAPDSVTGFWGWDDADEVGRA